MAATKIRSRIWTRLLTWPPAVTFSLVFLIYFVVAWFHLDPDFGWHLQSGQYFLAHGIPSHDVFTYTAASFPWINHEWLSDILVSILYGAGGYGLLVIIYAGLWTLSTWLVGRKAHNLVVILAVLAIVPFSGVRAITWSVLGLALLISLLKAKNRRWRLAIPLLLLVWANFHGSFVIGLAYLGYEVIRTKSWRLGLIGLAAALATFINPYGPSLYIEIIRTIGDSSLRENITEWAALTIPWMTSPFVLLWACAFALTGLKDWKKYLGFDVLMFLYSVASMRMLVLFVVVSLGVTADRLRAVAATIPRNLDRPRRRFITIVGSIITIVVLGVTINAFWNDPLNREYFYPTKAVAYLQDNPCVGRLFNHYDYGGYLIWKLPDEKVYIDGRMPSWSNDGVKYIDNYFRIIKDSNYRKSEFAKYDIKCVIMKKNVSGVSFATNLQRDHWRVAVEDNDSVLLLAPTAH